MSKDSELLSLFKLNEKKEKYDFFNEQVVSLKYFIEDYSDTNNQIRLELENFSDGKGNMTLEEYNTKKKDLDYRTNYLDSLIYRLSGYIDELSYLSCSMKLDFVNDGSSASQELIGSLDENMRLKDVRYETYKNKKIIYNNNKEIDEIEQSLLDYTSNDGNETTNTDNNAIYSDLKDKLSKIKRISSLRNQNNALNQNIETNNELLNKFNIDFDSYIARKKIAYSDSNYQIVKR